MWRILLAICCLAGCERIAPHGQKPPPRAADAATPADRPAATRPKPRQQREDDWFRDVTDASGVRFAYQNGRDAEQYTILETVGGGVAMIDFDLDDDLDLYFPGGGSISASPPRVAGAAGRFYRNDGDFKFTDVTRQVGLSAPGDYSHGCAAADYDRDGWPDLFVTCFGRSRLYHNDGGERFTDVTFASDLVVDGWSTAAAWADVDRDGWPDLYVVHYLDWRPDPDEFCGDRPRGIRDVCPPQKYPPAQDRLFLNLRDGTFGDVTAKAGLGLGKGLGVAAADFDGDGWIDFYVANDAGPNHLYRGGPNVQFNEQGVVSGSALNEYGAPEGSMGVDFGDYDGDGRGDLWVTNFEMEDNSLYHNDGQLSFTHATVKARLAGVCRPYVGFGTGFVDFDLDGWLDLFVIDGNVFYHLGQAPFAQPAFLFRNVGGAAFADVSERGGPYFSVPHAGRGAAAGDLDNDGAADLVVMHLDAPVALLKNRLSPPSWVRLRLRGTASDPNAVGAKVEMEYEGRQLVRWICSGSGYLSQFDPRLLLPASGDEPIDVAVTWLGGRRELFRGVPVRQTAELVEGQGAPR